MPFLSNRREKKQLRGGGREGKGMRARRRFHFPSLLSPLGYATCRKRRKKVEEKREEKKNSGKPKEVFTNCSP